MATYKILPAREVLLTLTEQELTGLSHIAAEGAERFLGQSKSSRIRKAAKDAVACISEACKELEKAPTSRTAAKTGTKARSRT
jgi:hypothetical protein